MTMPQSIDKLLETPAIRIFAGFSVLLVLDNGIGNVLFDLLSFVEGSNDWFGFVFDDLWNANRLHWFTFLVALGLWVGIGRAVGLEQSLITASGGAFFFWSTIVVNVDEYLPRRLDDLLDLFRASATLFVVVLAFATLVRVVTTDQASANPAAGSPATSAGHPRQPAVADNPLPGSPSAGWFADPKGEADLRWWDGAIWTDHTN